MILIKRVLISSGLLILLTLLTSVAIIYHYNDFYPLKSLASGLPPWPSPQAGERILVFAPHPDDETVGVGGYLVAASKAGAQIHIVDVTNGDAFRASVDYWYHTLSPTPALFQRYGKLRAAEARRAVSTLGIPASHLTFLGFPDEGTGRLWLDYWSPLKYFTSHYTKVDKVPYGFAYRPGLPYNAPNELSAIRGLLRKYRPQILVTLQANDVHPDHWATGAFVTLALQELEDDQVGWAKKTQVLRYIVHRGEWPLPKGYHPSLPLLPPPQFRPLGIHWYRFPVTRPEASRQERAILQYQTQTALMREFLLSFARSNTLLATDPVETVPRHEAWLSTAITQHWNGDRARILDPSRDTLMRDIDGSSDLLGLYLAENNRNLLVRLQVRDRLHSTTVAFQTRFYLLKRIHGTDQVTPLRLDLSPGAQPKIYDLLNDKELNVNLGQVIRGNELQTAIPLTLFQGVRHMMVGVSSRQRGQLVDRSAYRLFRLPDWKA